MGKRRPHRPAEVGGDEEALPPTAKRKVFERIALQMRQFAGVSLEERLDPWALAERLKLHVLSPDHVLGLSPEVRKTLVSGEGWSGGALQLPNGARLVFLNPAHSTERQAATLMEEISHLVLGHSPTQIHGVDVSETEQKRFRDYNANQEEAAYGVGSAALVPYFPLRRATEFGLETKAVAKHYGVSNALVEYRLKVCRLWDAHLANLAGRH